MYPAIKEINFNLNPSVTFEIPKSNKDEELCNFVPIKNHGESASDEEPQNETQQSDKIQPNRQLENDPIKQLTNELNAQLTKDPSSKISIHQSMNDDEEVTNEAKEKLNKVTVMITKGNELSDGKFFDPVSGIVFSYNHFCNETEGEAIVSEEYSQMNHNERYQKIFNAINSYVEESLRKTGRFQVCISKGSAYHDEESIMITIIGELFKIQSMRNGQWRSIWTCKRSATDQPWSVLGEVDAKVHYYEEGNVQLKASKKVSFTIPVEIEDPSRHLVSGIRKIEDEIQVALNLAYARLGESVLKRLRRQLPITRAKIDW